VEGDALGTLGADARQLRQGIDEVLKRTVVHVVSSSITVARPMTVVQCYHLTPPGR